MEYDARIDIFLFFLVFQIYGERARSDAASNKKKMSHVKIMEMHFWQCDNRCHQKSPKMRSLFQKKKGEKKPQSIINSVWDAIRIWVAVTFLFIYLFLQPFGHLRVSTSPHRAPTHRDIPLCFGLQLSSSPTTVRRKILILLKVVTKKKKERERRRRGQGRGYVNNLKEKQESIFKWLLVLIYN